MTGGVRGTAGDDGGRGRLAVLAGALTLAASLVLADAGVPPFHTWSYQLSWYPFLLLVDGAYAWRTGRFALLGRPRFAVSLFLWSAPVWFVFEALNFRLANWFYVNVPESAALRWPGYVAAFATVLPAIYLPDRWLRLWLSDADVAGPSLRVGTRERRVVFAGGFLFLALPLWRPDWFFPLVWGATVLLLAPWNHARDPGSSLLGDVERGRYGRIVRLLLAGLAAGIAWESMNVVAGTRWIYTVPGLEGLKIFEMPPLGFVGFTVFGLECRVMYRTLVNAGVAVEGWGDPWDGGEAPSGARPRPARTAGAALLAAAFCLGVSAGVDRWTVASNRPAMDGLPSVSAETSAALRSAGITGVPQLAASDSADVARAAGIPPDRAGRLLRVVRLAELRGLGPRNAELLVRGGVEDVCGLARADESRVVPLLAEATEARDAGHRRRVRVWIRAARQACPATGG